jgi:sporulation protein YlmC with PRC-barrel domain
MRGRAAKLSDRCAILSAVLAVCVIGAHSFALAQTPVPQQRASPQPAAAQPAASQPPASQSAAPRQKPATATPATVLDDKDVESILGREIYSATGEDMGKIVDVLVDHTGQVRAAIIDFGGFLGVGTRKIAIDWQAIKFAPDGASDRIVLSLTRDQVRVAPEYKQGEPIVVLGSSAASSPPAAASTDATPANAAPSK